MTQDTFERPYRGPLELQLMGSEMLHLVSEEGSCHC